jgi:uncharacterized tellurite resistance protein B-like protein
MSTFTELHSSSVARDTYGVSGMPAPLFISVARALKILLAADGAIHPAELNAYIETCKRYGASPDMLRDLQAFNPQDTTIDECFAGIDPMLIPVKSLLYDVIKIAKADNDYARGERTAVTIAASLLGVDLDWVEKITALVDAEAALDALKLRMLTS